MAGKKKEQRRLRKEKRRLSEKKAESEFVYIKTTLTEESMTPENSAELPAGEWFDMFKKEALDRKGFGGIVDGILRNTVRMTVQAWTRDFATIPLLRPKNSLWLQLLLVDEDRVIQGKFHGLGAEVALAKSHTNVVQRSRILFREAVPSLLQDGAVDRWIFSRSLFQILLIIKSQFRISYLPFQFLPGCNGSMDDVIEFPMYDPLDCLLELPKDIPSGVKCTKAFLFFAGDFPNKDGFSSRGAILKLLHELLSPNGNRNLHGFWVCAASAKVSKEKVNELKGIHIPVKRA